MATEWGLTDLNYKELTEIYKEYQAKGLEIFAFPCNQFGEQEPGTDAEVEKFATEKYGATYQLMSKIEVNGAGAHPLFDWLRKNSSL